MLLESDKEALGRIVNLAHAYSACPFSWDKRKMVLRIDNSLTNRIGSVVHVAHWAAYLLFLLGCNLIAVQSGREKDLDFFLRLVVTFVGSPILILQLAVFHDGKEGAVYLNAGFHIAAKFQKEFGIKGRKARETISMKLMRLIMHKCLIFGSIGYAIACLLIFLLKPDDGLFYYSVLPPYWQGWPAFILNALIVYRLMIGVACGAIALVSISWITALVFFSMEDQLNMSTKRYWTKNCLRTVSNVKRIYNYVCIVHNLLAKDIVSFWLGPIHLTITRAVHICNVVVIRHYANLPPLYTLIFFATSMMFMVGWLTILRLMADYHQSTAKIIKSWKKYPSPFTSSGLAMKIWEKELKYMQPLIFKIGQRIPVRNKTLLGVLTTFLRGTVRLLVALNKRPILPD